MKETYVWKEEEQEQVCYEYWLHQLPGIGNKKLSRLLAGEMTAKRLYEMTEKELEEYLHFCYEVPKEEKSRRVESELRCLLNPANRTGDGNPVQRYKRLKEKGIEFISVNNSRYPNRLREIPDRPFALYKRGIEAQADGPAIAVVGARLCSEYGRYIAGSLGRLCAQLGIHLVSGLASGIDGISQNAARGAGGLVTAVLGNGVDICYPSENRKLYEELVSGGILYSEYVPGTQPRAQNFPPRNRIISGLSDAVIVVEAKGKSGTLITVDMALEQGRDVYVVPGRLTDPMSYGCNRLISQGAAVIYDIEETLYELKSRYTVGCLREKGKRLFKQTVNLYPSGSTKALIYDLLDTMPKPVQQIYEQLSEHTELTIAQLQTELIYMEMEKTIFEEGGSYGRILGD